MSSLYAFSYAVLAAAVGIALPGMLNMTAVSIRLRKGYVAARQFVFGTAISVGCQALAAIFFANFLMRNPNIIAGFQRISIVVFVGLALYFLTKRSAVHVAEPQPVSKSRSFFGGVFLGFMNFLALPYLLAAGTWGMANDYLHPNWTDRLLFMAGAMVGSLLVNFGYVASADWVKRKANFIALNMNRILGVFFLILAAWQLWVVLS